MKDQTRMPRPISYGSEGRAREYVNSLAKRGPQSGPVYIIVAPKLRTHKRLWPMLLTRLRELLPGIEFRLWPQIVKAAGENTGSRVDYIHDNHAGAVLVGFRQYHMLRVGPVALAEATGFAATGKPMLVLTGSRLVAWPDCQVLKIKPGSQKDNFVAAYVLLPLEPIGKPLPTFAASLHMLGIRDPEIIARAAGLTRGRGPRGAVRPAAGSGTGRGSVPPVRFVTAPRTLTEDG